MLKISRWEIPSPAGSIKKDITEGIVPYGNVSSFGNGSGTFPGELTSMYIKKLHIIYVFVNSMVPARNAGREIFKEEEK